MHVSIHRQRHIYTYVCMYIYTHIYMYVCVCVCVYIYIDIYMVYSASSFGGTRSLKLTITPFYHSSHTPQPLHLKCSLYPCKWCAGLQTGLFPTHLQTFLPPPVHITPIASFKVRLKNHLLQESCLDRVPVWVEHLSYFFSQHAVHISTMHLSNS